MLSGSCHDVISVMCYPAIVDSLYTLCILSADIVLAVPHVHRPKEDYLLRTLTSLFEQMSGDEKQKTVLVVMVAEPFNESIFDSVSQKISEKLVLIITIILVNNSFVIGRYTRSCVICKYSRGCVI